MGQPTPLTSPEVRRVCALGGVQGKISSQKLVTLKELERTLVHAIQEVDAQVSAKSWTAILVAVKTVKVICDVVVDLMAQSLEKNPATAMPAKAVSLIYDRATLVTEGFNGNLDLKTGGQHIAETHVDVLGEATSPAVSSVLARSKTFLKTAQSIYDIIQTIDEIPDANTGVESARRTAQARLHEIRRQITMLEKEYAACGLY